MYDFLRGHIVESKPGRIVIEVNGVGFVLITPDHTPERIGARTQDVLIWTHLQFREDHVSLFGFSDKHERELFLLLLKVSGIGPKMAIQILSGISPEELVRAMIDEDWKRLTLISGIGPKTARRLLIELKESLTLKELQAIPSGTIPTDPIINQAYKALENLGFQYEQIRNATKDIPPDTGLEEVIRIALSRM